MLDLGCLPHPSDLQASAVAGVRSWREIPSWGRRAQPGLQECGRQFACEFCIGSWEPRLLPSVSAQRWVCGLGAVKSKAAVNVPGSPISSVVKRSIPVDQGTRQRLRLMNLNADKPKNLDKGGSQGVEREYNSHPKGCAFRVTVNACVTSDSSFFWERLFLHGFGGSFPWQPPLPHIWHLNEMAPKAQGSTRSPPQPAYPAKDVEKHWAERALTLSLAGEAALRGEPRLQTLPVASALTAHRTGPPPISPSKRKFSVDPGDDDLDCDGDHASKMSRTFAPHLNKTANGDCRKDPRERSRSPIERAVAPTMSLHGGPLYASLPSLSMEQPLALTKNSLDAGRPAGLSPTLAPVERQQNRPSVITCASASARNCNLSHCPVAHSGCAAGPASYRRTPSSTCDPVVEEHFRRSLGKNYKEPEPAPNSVSITGSVDDHFAKALGDTWLQIKAAKDGASSSPESASRRGQPASPSAHMVSHGHSPSVVS
ncbi:hypothetical protein CapIbe_019017 [Capra ibex]